VEFLSPSGLSDFFNRFDGSWATDSLWNSLRFALAGIRDSDLASRRFSSARRSTAISLPKLDSLIVSSLPPLFLSEFAGKQYFLLYRGSRDGFNAADFHRQCDGHERTVVLIQDLNGYMFGGYTPVAWRSTGNSQPDPSMSTFVFTLTNPHGIAPRKFTQRPNWKSCAILCNLTLGPAFGGTFYTMDSCNQSQGLRRQNYTGGFNQYFLNDTGVDHGLLFTGSPTFVVREMEVFELKD
jgi:hypothetical protein